MTEYLAHDNGDGTWSVKSIDWMGREHETIFKGPLAVDRAKVYADFMNGKNKQHIGYPNE